MKDLTEPESAWVDRFRSAKETLSVAEIPTRDLVRQYCLVEDEIRAALDRTLAIGEYAPGPAVAAFEREYATYCGAKHCVGVANGPRQCTWQWQRVAWALETR